MSDIKTEKNLAQAFAQLSKSAARKKAYSRKATEDGRLEVAHFLRAMAKSEAVQAHRLFNNMIGKIDTSDEYIKTIFAKEVQDILKIYTELIDNTPAERPALLHALTQLRAAETRLRSFYSPNKRDAQIQKEARYFVCRFCGYLSTDHPPKKCPVCGAATDAFQEIK